jgi:hypothetical protein
MPIHDFAKHLFIRGASRRSDRSGRSETAPLATGRCLPHARRGARAVLLVALVAGVGCGSIGPRKLVSSHEGYNDAVQLTVTREVLKNIVRTRYADPMQFIKVSTINAQSSISTGANVGASGLGTAGGAGASGANVGYSDSPTITYVPQSDASFNKSIDSPIELQEAVAYVFEWGSSAPHEVGLVVAAVNDAADRAGSRGERYRERVDALVRLVERGATLRQFRELYPRHEPIPLSKVSSLAYVLAAQSDLYFYDVGGGKVNIASKHIGIGLFVPKPHEGEVADELRLLGLDPGRALYPIRPPSEAEPSGLQKNTIWLSPRSVEGMMDLAAMSVEVPSAHAASGVAPSDGPAANSGVTLPLRIRHSDRQPGSPYRVQHRGYWFYIDDTDTESKRLFSTIVQAYTSRIGSKTSADAVPQVVLPVGGGCIVERRMAHFSGG